MKTPNKLGTDTTEQLKFWISLSRTSLHSETAAKALSTAGAIAVSMTTPEMKAELKACAEIADKQASVAKLLIADAEKTLTDSMGSLFMFDCTGLIVADVVERARAHGIPEDKISILGWGPGEFRVDLLNGLSPTEISEALCPITPTEGRGTCGFMIARAIKVAAAEALAEGVEYSLKTIVEAAMAHIKADENHPEVVRLSASFELQAGLASMFCQESIYEHELTAAPFDLKTAFEPGRVTVACFPFHRFGAAVDVAAALLTKHLQRHVVARSNDADWEANQKAPLRILSDSIDTASAFDLNDTVNRIGRSAGVHFTGLNVKKPNYIARDEREFAKDCAATAVRSSQAFKDLQDAIAIAETKIPATRSPS